MKNEKAEKENKESQEVKAEEELLKLGLKTVPENIRAVLELQKTRQHPENFKFERNKTVFYKDIVESDSLEYIGDAMKDQEISRIVHAEDPYLWVHCKLAMTLAQFLDIPQEKKDDLKLIMLYHDLGKATPGLEDRPDIKAIQRKELEKGKLYKVAKGHATERSEDIENGFKANGISGRKLEVFMNVVQNHMETSLSEMSGTKLVKLFENFGTTDEEKRETAELLAFAIQVDGNACQYLEFDDKGQLLNPKKVNTTGRDFSKIWEKYEAEKN